MKISRLLPLVPVMLLAVVLGAPQAQAYPEPSLGEASWQLEFEYEQPRAISVEDAAGNVRWFWYMPYQVTNLTGQTRLFVPEFTIATDTGRIISAGKGVPATVYRAIERRLNNPLLESPIEVVGELLRGRDFARESVAIWPAFEGEDVDEFSVFVGGLSGETQTIQNPLTGDPVLMRRSKMITFRIPGNPPTPQNQTVVAAGEQDVMR